MNGGNVLAALVSFFIPGLGQLIQGRVAAAALFVLLWIGGGVVFFLMMFGSAAANSGAAGFSSIIIGIVSSFLFSCVAAVNCATYQRPAAGQVRQRVKGRGLNVAAGRGKSMQVKIAGVNPEFKNCPACAEEVKFEALKCKHCGESLSV